MGERLHAVFVKHIGDFSHGSEARPRATAGLVITKGLEKHLFPLPRKTRSCLLPLELRAVAVIAMLLDGKLRSRAGQASIAIRFRGRPRRRQRLELTAQIADFIIAEVLSNFVHAFTLPVARAIEHELPLREIARLSCD